MLRPGTNNVLHRPKTESVVMAFLTGFRCVKVDLFLAVEVRTWTVVAL